MNNNMHRFGYVMANLEAISGLAYECNEAKPNNRFIWKARKARERMRGCLRNH